MEHINSFEPKNKDRFGGIEDREFCAIAQQIVEQQEGAIINALEGEVCTCVVCSYVLCLLRCLFVCLFELCITSCIELLAHVLRGPAVDLVLRASVCRAHANTAHQTILPQPWCVSDHCIHFLFVACKWRGVVRLCDRRE